MKVAVYTICRDEEQFVERFAKCLIDEADEVHVTDTGSTDKTVQALQDFGIIVHHTKVVPWRFDTPRNTSLSYLPLDTDICVCIDLDEVLEPGWRAAAEEAWTSVPGVSRLRYKYAWSHNPDGTPATSFWYDKIHARHDYRWVKPVHEILARSTEPEVQAYTDKIKLHHWPDMTKSRGSYLPLLELACREEPEDDRSSHYLGREYHYYGKHNESIRELERHLSLPTAQWKPERAASMRMLSKECTALGRHDDAFSWAMRACAEAQSEREPWVDLASLAYARGDHTLTYAAALKATAIADRPMTYICEPQAWGAHPWDLLSFSAWQLGHKQQALLAGEKALELEPDNARFAANVKWMRNLLSTLHTA